MRKALWILNFVVLGCLVYVACELAFDGRSAGTDATSEPPADAGATERSAPPVVSNADRAAILNRNIFGGAGTGGDVRPSTPPRPPTPVKAMPTQLKLELYGTVAAGPQISRAVIMDLTSRESDVYKIGDVVQGARIETIERNRVILEYQGRREELCVKMTNAAPPRPAPPGRSAPMPPPGDVIQRMGMDSFEVDRKALLTRIGGMEAVLRATKLKPYVVDGKMEGLQITGLKNMSMARFVGIEENDVIQKVNGQKLTSQGKAFQVFRKARRQSQLNVELLRGTEKKALSFRVK